MRIRVSNLDHTNFQMKNKNCTKFKGLVCLDPNGSVMFGSKLFPESITDETLFDQSKLLIALKSNFDCGNLKQGDGIILGKGVNIENEILQLGLSVHRSVVYSEKALARIKDLKLLSNKIHYSLSSKIEEIWQVSCLVTNFPSLINGYF